MAAIEILSIEEIEGSSEWLFQWFVDIPKPSSTNDGYYLTIAGWVVGRDDRATAVSVLHDEHLVTRTPLEVRCDVNRMLQLADDDLQSGFEVTLNVITLPESFTITLRAALAGGPRIDFAVIRGRHTPLRSSFEPSMQPLSVTSLGRTGTTLLLHMLSRHRELTVHEVFPFEARIASYWMHALTVLSGPANPNQSSHPDTFLLDPFFIGHSPAAADTPLYGPSFRAWIRGDRVEDIAAFCQQTIESAYTRIARDQGREPGRYFVEKNIPPEVPGLQRQLYAGMREIILVRDFRDMICSMKAFDTKRQNLSFQGEEMPVELFVSRVMGDYRRLVKWWEAHRDASLIVRYEDLVADPHHWLRRIAEYAGIDASAPAIEAMVSAATAETDASRAHRTTEHWSRSIGRYQRDMSDDIREFCLELGGELLTTLGYATGREAWRERPATSPAR